MLPPGGCLAERHLVHGATVGLLFNGALMNRSKNEQAGAA
jgi:hypothetical protein